MYLVTLSFLVYAMQFHFNIFRIEGPHRLLNRTWNVPSEFIENKEKMSSMPAFLSQKRQIFSSKEQDVREWQTINREQIFIISFIVHSFIICLFLKIAHVYIV